MMRAWMPYVNLLIAAAHGKCFQQPFEWAATRTVAGWASACYRPEPDVNLVHRVASRDCNEAMTAGGRGRALIRSRCTASDYRRLGVVQTRASVSLCLIHAAGAAVLDLCDLLQRRWAYRSNRWRCL
jgi:hypothetical protein